MMPGPKQRSTSSGEGSGSGSGYGRQKNPRGFKSNRKGRPYNSGQKGSQSSNNDDTIRLAHGKVITST